MNWEYLINALLAAGLLAYLSYVLIRPEEL
jgi:K+-transporting ATPase KdpF subunit